MATDPFKPPSHTHQEKQIKTNATGKVLPRPTIILIFGVSIFFATVVYAYPHAVDLIETQFWAAVERGYKDHFEESDTIDMALNIFTAVFVIPASMALGIGGYIYSEHTTGRGYGRYGLAIGLAVFPYILIVAMLIDYCAKAR